MGVANCMRQKHREECKMYRNVIAMCCQVTTKDIGSNMYCIYCHVRLEEFSLTRGFTLTLKQVTKIQKSVYVHTELVCNIL